MAKLELSKLTNMSSKSSEAYRTLRSNIEFCGKDVKTIAFTSCVPNEGKTTVAINVAAAIAKSGNTVLFVDADMRQSVFLGRIGNTEKVKGLSNILVGKCELEDAVYETSEENLYVLPCGTNPPNPSELLSSDEFKSFLEDVKKKYDYVLIDTPPIVSVIDGAIVASVCDGAAIVVGCNTVSYKLVKKVQKQLEKAGANILGCILNFYVNTDSYYGKYYGKKYGKYYDKYYNSGNQDSNKK